MDDVTSPQPQATAEAIFKCAKCGAVIYREIADDRAAKNFVVGSFYEREPGGKRFPFCPDCNKEFEKCP